MTNVVRRQYLKVCVSPSFVFFFPSTEDDCLTVNIDRELKKKKELCSRLALGKGGRAGVGIPILDGSNAYLHIYARSHQHLTRSNGHLSNFLAIFSGFFLKGCFQQSNQSTAFHI